MSFLRPAGCLTAILVLAVHLPADPLSKSRSIDFFRDTTSRDLHGIATRSDGRLLNGPTVNNLPAGLDGELLWTLAPDGQNLLVGTGPDGRILSLTPGPDGKFASRVVLDLPENHVFAVHRLPNGDLLVGTSPQGTLVLARHGKVIARVALPVDSVLDFCLPAGDPTAGERVLVATGNPGRIYAVDLARFAAAGDEAKKIDDQATLATKGITLWGSVRDDNIRRLISLPDGRVIAGSAPKGNIYAFPAQGGAPMVLDENRHAEVTDLLPWSGGFYATITFTSEMGENRVKHQNQARNDDDKAAKAETDTATLVLNEPASAHRFSGRSQLVWFPDDGFPEVVASRANTAFYRLQTHEGRILITGGEEGELLGYDPLNRRSLTYAGAVPAQVNGIVPAAGRPGVFYAIGNNPTALVSIDFGSADSPWVETKRIDLGSPALIGAVRFNRPSTYPVDQLKVEMRASFGSDELEGWSPWQSAAPSGGSWKVPGLRGRYLQLRLTPKSIPFEFSSAEIYYLPQNRRPQLVDFRVLAPNFAIIPAAERSDNPISTLGQVLQSRGKDQTKDRDNFLSSQVVPQSGTQVVFWTISDPDGDNVVTTFSLRHDGESKWTDLAVNNTDPYVQFEISHLPEGLYHTRLVARETAPRPVAERLSTTFETDDFLVDRTPPHILAATVEQRGGLLCVTVQARDALSLLAGIELNLNNGYRTSVEQPVDGILDSKEETFNAEIPIAETGGSTSVEVIVYDSVGNSSAQRLSLPAH